MTTQATDPFSRRMADPDWSKSMARQSVRRYRSLQLKKFALATATFSILVVAAFTFSERQATLTASALTDPFNTFYDSGFPDYSN